MSKFKIINNNIKQQIIPKIISETRQDINLSGMDILNPENNFCYIQKNDNCDVIIFADNYQPKTCFFEIQTKQGGLYLMNNSSMVYHGNVYLPPNKVCQFNILKDNETWKIYSDLGHNLEENSILLWTNYFNRNITGAPPLIARKYAIFINGIYNCLVDYNLMLPEAVINESAKILYEFLTGKDGTVIYDSLPKLSTQNQTILINYLNGYKNTQTIPSAATNPSASIPTEPNRWQGTNPVLPNWKTDNINYLVNEYKDISPSPYANMTNDAENLKQMVMNEQTRQIAKHFAKGPPPIHLIEIASKLCHELFSNQTELAQFLSLISIGLADAGVYAWTVKYTYWGQRPFQFIPNFIPVITTPNFPGYISGHSTFSAVWQEIISNHLPKFKNIAKFIAELSGMSRLYGGIHFSDDNIYGLSAGRNIGKSVYNKLLAGIKNSEKLVV
jgi:hypothetical protein